MSEDAKVFEEFAFRLLELEKERIHLLRSKNIKDVSGLKSRILALEREVAQLKLPVNDKHTKLDAIIESPANITLDKRDSFGSYSSYTVSEDTLTPVLHAKKLDKALATVDELPSSNITTRPTSGTGASIFTSKSTNKLMPFITMPSAFSNYNNNSQIDVNRRQSTGIKSMKPPLSGGQHSSGGSQEGITIVSSSSSSSNNNVVSGADISPINLLLSTKERRNTIQNLALQRSGTMLLTNNHNKTASAAIGPRGSGSSVTLNQQQQHLQYEQSSDAGDSKDSGFRNSPSTAMLASSNNNNSVTTTPIPGAGTTTTTTSSKIMSVMFGSPATATTAATSPVPGSAAATMVDGSGSKTAAAADHPSQIQSRQISDSISVISEDGYGNNSNSNSSSVVPSTSAAQLTSELTKEGPIAQASEEEVDGKQQSTAVQGMAENETSSKDTIAKAIVKSPVPPVVAAEEVQEAAAEEEVEEEEQEEGEEEEDADTNDPPPLLEFCLVEADWQTLSSPLVMIAPMVPPQMLWRYPSNIIHALTNNTLHIQDQHFFFPSGVKVEIVPYGVMEVKIRANNHKRHIVPFTDQKGRPLYACCLTVVQAYKIEDIRRMHPQILENLLRMYKAKFAAKCIQKAFRQYQIYKKNRLWLGVDITNNNNQAASAARTPYHHLHSLSKAPRSASIFGGLGGGRTASVDHQHQQLSSHGGTGTASSSSPPDSVNGSTTASAMKQQLTASTTASGGGIFSRFFRRTAANNNNNNNNNNNAANAAVGNETTHGGSILDNGSFHGGVGGSTGGGAGGGGSMPSTSTHGMSSFGGFFSSSASAATTDAVTPAAAGRGRASSSAITPYTAAAGGVGAAGGTGGGGKALDRHGSLPYPHHNSDDLVKSMSTSRFDFFVDSTLDKTKSSIKKEEEEDEEGEEDEEEVVSRAGEEEDKEEEEPGAAVVIDSRDMDTSNDEPTAATGSSATTTAAITTEGEIASKDTTTTTTANKKSSAKARKTQPSSSSSCNKRVAISFLTDKVVLGQRCYCIISPIPEYTFIFTVLDAIAESENKRFSRASALLGGSVSAATTTTGASTAKGSNSSYPFAPNTTSPATITTITTATLFEYDAITLTENRSKYLQQVTDYMDSHYTSYYTRRASYYDSSIGSNNNNCSNIGNSNNNLYFLQDLIMNFSVPRVGLTYNTSYSKQQLLQIQSQSKQGQQVPTSSDDSDSPGPAGPSYAVAASAAASSTTIVKSNIIRVGTIVGTRNRILEKIFSYQCSISGSSNSAGSLDQSNSSKRSVSVPSSPIAAAASGAALGALDSSFVSSRSKRSNSSLPQPPINNNNNQPSNKYHYYHDPLSLSLPHHDEDTIILAHAESDQLAIIIPGATAKEDSVDHIHVPTTAIAQTSDTSSISSKKVVATSMSGQSSSSSVKQVFDEVPTATSTTTTIITTTRNPIQITTTAPTIPSTHLILHPSTGLTQRSSGGGEATVYYTNHYALRMKEYGKIPMREIKSLLSTREWTCSVLLTHLSSQVIFKIINLLLMEKSLIIYGKNPGIVTAITLGVVNLITPFLWEGIFIPLVPDNARELFGAPVPLIIGTINPPRLMDVSNVTAVLHLNDDSAMAKFVQSPVLAAPSAVQQSTSMVTPMKAGSDSLTTPPPAQSTTPTGQQQLMLLSPASKQMKLKEIEFQAWFVRLPEVSADMPIDEEISRRIDHTRHLLSQHIIHELQVIFTLPPSRKRWLATTTDSATSSMQSQQPVSLDHLPDENVTVKNNSDRILMSNLPENILLQIRIILASIKRYNFQLCGQAFGEDPNGWKRFLRRNNVTQSEEFYPDNFLEPLRNKLEFQDAMVHTQLFVSFVDRVRREQSMLDRVRVYIADWIYGRILMKRYQLKKRLRREKKKQQKLKKQTPAAGRKGGAGGGSGSANVSFR